ncbi:hypothetical protein BC831DRAFT_476441 [Entophlyctis helioformis]|nr:hypothetical protein BC831DRAFT_476441 [Entophlyctis helioformis]
MSSYSRISANTSPLAAPLSEGRHSCSHDRTSRKNQPRRHCALIRPHKAGLTRQNEQPSRRQHTMVGGLACVALCLYRLARTRIGHAASPVHTHATKSKPTQCLLGDSCVATSTSDTRSRLNIPSWLGSPAAADSTDQPIVSASPYTSRGATTAHGISDVSPVRESSTLPCPTIASAASDQGPQPLSTVANRTNKKRERDAQDVGRCESAEPRSPPKRACLPRSQDDGSRATSPLYPSSGSAYLPSPYMPKTPHYSPIEPRWSPEASFIHLDLQ